MSENASGFRIKLASSKPCRHPANNVVQGEIRIVCTFKLIITLQINCAIIINHGDPFYDFRSRGIGVIGYDDVAAHWQLDREFTPQMPTEERDARYAKWQMAVERSLAWEQPE